jgi:hypothetical protein
MLVILMTILCLTIDIDGGKVMKNVNSLDQLKIEETVYFNKQTNKSKRLEKMFEMMSSLLQATLKSSF